MRALDVWRGWWASGIYGAEQKSGRAKGTRPTTDRQTAVWGRDTQASAGNMYGYSYFVVAGSSQGGRVTITTGRGREWTSSVAGGENGRNRSGTG